MNPLSCIYLLSPLLQLKRVKDGHFLVQYLFRPSASYVVRPRPRTRKEPGREPSPPRSPPPFLLRLHERRAPILFLDDSSRAPIQSPPSTTVGTAATDDRCDRGHKRPRSHRRSPERPRPDPLPRRPSRPRPRTTVATAATSVRARTVGPRRDRALIPSQDERRDHGHGRPSRPRPQSLRARTVSP